MPRLQMREDTYYDFYLNDEDAATVNKLLANDEDKAFEWLESRFPSWYKSNFGGVEERSFRWF